MEPKFENKTDRTTYATIEHCNIFVVQQSVPDSIQPFVSAERAQWMTLRSCKACIVVMPACSISSSNKDVALRKR